MFGDGFAEWPYCWVCDIGDVPIRFHCSNRGEWERSMDSRCMMTMEAAGFGAATSA